jgi:hypothetical protein
LVTSDADRFVHTFTVKQNKSLDRTLGLQIVTGDAVLLAFGQLALLFSIHGTRSWYLGPDAYCPNHFVVTLRSFTENKTRKIWLSEGNFSLHHRCVQTGSGAHPASYPTDTGGPFPGTNRQGRKVGHSHLLPRLRMRGAIPALPNTPPDMVLS